MAIGINDNFQILASKPIDARYFNNLVPYASVAEANTEIKKSERHEGLFVNINKELYWYKDGIEDSDLIKFSNDVEIVDATESEKGIVKLSTQVVIQDEATTDDETAVTPKKFWLGIQRLLSNPLTWLGRMEFKGGLQFIGTAGEWVNKILRTDGSGNVYGVDKLSGSDINEWSDKEDKSNKGANNGYAELDAGGKIPLSRLPSTLLIYKGVWNPETNTPALTANDVSKKGWVYTVTRADETSFNRFGIDWKRGDWAIYNDSGNIEKSDNSDDVTSVNGQQGNVVLKTEHIVESTDKLYVTSAEKTAWNNKLTGTKASDADLQVTTAPADDNKYPNRLGLFNWWAWVKTQASMWTLSFLAGTGESVLKTTAAGKVERGWTVNERDVIDVDIIAAINAASFNKGNNYTETIYPANGKIMYAGQVCYIADCRYIAVYNNTIYRSTAGGNNGYTFVGESADYTATDIGMFDLDVLVSSSRTFKMPPPSDHVGCRCVVVNKNTHGTYKWNFDSTYQPINLADNSLVALTNKTIYDFISDGTNWIKL